MCTVNHSKHFKDPETGVHTNNVEGIHGIIKKIARNQFGRLPSLNDDGFTNYLDLLVWVTNLRLSKVPEFYGWCLTLRRWTKEPIEDFDHFIPVWEEDRMPGCNDEAENDDDEVEDDQGEGDGDGQDEDWFNKDHQVEVDFDLGFQMDDGVDEGDGVGVAEAV